MSLWVVAPLQAPADEKSPVAEQFRGGDARPARTGFHDQSLCGLTAAMLTTIIAAAQTDW